MDYILNNPWIGAIVILISQLLFMFLRTLNIISISEMSIKNSVLSGIGLDILWLISLSIGLTSIISGEWQPVLAFILGSTLGRYFGLMEEIKRHGDKKTK